MHHIYSLYKNLFFMRSFCFIIYNFVYKILKVLQT